MHVTFVWFSGPGLRSKCAPGGKKQMQVLCHSKPAISQREISELQQGECGGTACRAVQFHFDMSECGHSKSRLVAVPIPLTTDFLSSACDCAHFVTRA